MCLKIPSTSLLAAAGVHCFTAAGGVLGLFALLAAAQSNWTATFAWLGAALIVDGADGPLARFFEVKKVLPRFSGEDLDHVIDYLTYVTVPAFIVARSAIVPAELGLPLAAVIMMVSLYHFSDTNSKTDEGYFVGFPAIWNVAVLYLFVLDIPPVPAAVLLSVCAVLTFVPLRWLHPLRVRLLRLVTIVIVAAWAVASALVLYHGFPGDLPERIIYVIAAAYFIAFCIGPAAQRLLPRRPPGNAS
ncbi:MAG: CDP-alcohol phosphatidyltransferase family protein [Rhodomicrobium sp.]